jgi:hypothetical protein
MLEVSVCISLAGDLAADMAGYREFGQRRAACRPRAACPKPILLRPRRVLTMAIDSDNRMRSRRALLGASLGAIAATVAGMASRAMPTRAADGDPVRVGLQHEGILETSITVPDGTAIAGISTNGRGLYGQSSSDVGVHGISNSNVGVFGSSTSGIGVYGRSNAGSAVKGQAFSDGATSIYAVKANGGPPILGEITDTSSTWGAVNGTTYGTGSGVVGSALNGRGTSGRAFGKGDGIYGQSDLGRGGRFKGKKAQIRLDPSTAATHPPSGAGGDFFVDTSKRLWFCKGGTTWKQLA